MKRFFVLPLILFVLCGCSKKETVFPKTNNISFCAQFEFENTKYDCYAKSKESALNLVVRAPKEIEGLSLRIDKKGIKHEFAGISQQLDDGHTFKFAPARILFEVFDNLKNNSASYSNKNCKIVGNASGYEYIYFFSPSGLPLSLEIKELNLNIKFSNVVLE